MSDPGLFAAPLFTGSSAALLVPTMVSAFLLGLGGVAHCAGMCGGIVTALARRGRGEASTRPVFIALSRQTSPPASAGLPTGVGLQIAYNIGRVGSYTAAGAMAGAVGSAAWFASNVLPIQQIAFVMACLILIATGLHLAGLPVLSRWLEALGAQAWRLIEPAAKASLRGQLGLRGAFIAGAAWGWVPCGMVYGVLTAALVSGSAPAGAAIALAFGLGTLPGLTTLGWVAERKLATASRTSAVLRMAGALMVLWGAAGLLRIDPLAHLQQFGEACVSWLQ